MIDYLLDPERRGMIAVMALALLLGLGAGFFLSKRQAPQSTKPDAPIQWNKVQALPKPTRNVEDKEWQERSDALDSPRPTAGKRAEGTGNADD